MNTAMIAAEMQCGVASLKSRPTCKEITPQSTENYCHAVVKPLEVNHYKSSKKYLPPTVV